MVANIMHVDSAPQPWGSKGINLTFSEHDHAAYQIIENHKCSNMVANILPTVQFLRSHNSKYSFDKQL